MDPQHRLLPETSREALEHAGQSPVPLDSAPVGVLLGISGHDIAAVGTPREVTQIDEHFVSGIANSRAVSRIPHLFGLPGPSLAVDTVCSSSLVASNRANAESNDMSAQVIADLLAEEIRES